MSILLKIFCSLYIQLPKAYAAASSLYLCILNEQRDCKVDLGKLFLFGLTFDVTTL